MAKITKMQQRRGLRRDLPLPLAPGEFGLATDSRELFIGNDTTDSLSGIQNRTIQLGFFATGFDFTNSNLQNNITEFIVKRDVITGITGTGWFNILGLHSGLSVIAAHASGVKLEGGINDQSLTIHKYSPASSSHAKLIPGDPDGTPVTINDYKIQGSGATQQIQFTKALVATDVIYVVHLTKKDLETYLINGFNASYDTPAGGGTALTNLTQKIDLSQLYFDESTGEGFIGFNDSQIPKADNSTNIPNAGVATSSSNMSVKEWFEEYLVHAGAAAEPHLNSAISGLGDAYWGNGDIVTMDTFSALDASRTAGTYTGVTGTSDSSGTVGTFNIVVDGTGDVTSVTVVTGGNGHNINDTITIANANLGNGISSKIATMDTFSAADALRTAGTYTGVTGTSSGTGTVGTFNIVVGAGGAVTSVTVVTGGSGHAISDTITIANANLGNGTNGEIVTMDTFSGADASRTGPYTYTGVTGTSSGTGTVGTFDIVVDSTGDVTSVTVVTGGSGHAVNDTITIADSSLGSGGAVDFTMDVATLLYAVDFTMDVATINSSQNGGKGIAKFGSDAGTTAPTYSLDEDLTFATRSHISAKNLSAFLNQSWLSEGSDPTRQLSHLRSNIRVVTDENVGDVFSNLTIGNPSTRTVSDTSKPGSTATNPLQGDQNYRPVGSVYTTTQALVGVVRYNLTTISNLEIDYSIKFTDSVGSPTYHVVRTGRASVSFPLLADGTNVKGHGAILDQWNEIDIISATGAVTFSATQTFEFAVAVAKRVTTKGDPVLEQNYADSVANTGGTGTAAYTTKYGEAHGSASYVDNDSTSSTYQNYFGFLLYQNKRGVAGTIEFIQRRF